jgi:hypothetical protein
MESASSNQDGVVPTGGLEQPDDVLRCLPYVFRLDLRVVHLDEGWSNRLARSLGARDLPVPGGP